MKRNKAIEIFRNTKSIEGWFTKQAAMLFALVDEVQKSNDIRGDLFEIGVHHGKSAIFLGAMIHEGEKFVVCDLFGSQTSNVSISGKGNREIFEGNMARQTANDIDLRIFEKSSGELRSAEIGTNYRFFHIDGGHNVEEALGDLRLAAECVVDRGVIVLDDAFKPEWPGVTEAIVRFLEERPEFRAVAVGFNKLIMARREFADIYTAVIADGKTTRAFGICYPWHFKELPFMGQSLGIFYIPTWITKKKLRHWLKCYYFAHDWLQIPLLRPVFSIFRGKSART